MKPHFQPDASRPSSWLSITVGSLAALAVFLSLPAGKSGGEAAPLRPEPLHEVPPPPPPPPPSAELPETTKTPEVLEMPPPMPRLTLDQLDVALSLSSGGGSTDFSLTAFTLAPPPPEGFEFFELHEVDREPRPIVQVEPAFPYHLNRPGFMGRVVVLFIVDEQGRVTEASIEACSHPELAQPSLDAVRRWRFEAGTHAGQPVRVRMRLPFVFKPSR